MVLISEEERGFCHGFELYLAGSVNGIVYPLRFLKELALMGTAPDAGQFMTFLLGLVNAKKTIKIRVFTGYSLLLTSLAIPEDGKITSIDVSQKVYDDIGLPIMQKDGVERKINFVESPALPVLEKMLENAENEGTFDFSYDDGDKVNYWNYHEKLLTLLRIGGVVVYGNTLWGGSVAMSDESLVPEHYRASRCHSIEFNKLIAVDSRIRLSQVPVGDGSTVCIRLH
ncbi:hypothetical protein MKX03_021950 [Papaver bracteatum]|nr:hypothetical protein MKX03_021950 [Papaver bracteatum]